MATGAGDTALSEYESAMFMELLEDNTLFITAKGISMDRVITKFLQMYCDPASLVLVVNCSPSQQEYTTETLKATGIPTPQIITNEISSSERKSVYMNGGVLFVTSRILVVDMLTKRIPIHLVTGVVVYRAHKIIDSCQEAFVLRLYREQNKTGFIKAFSDSPQAFSRGFFFVEQVMKNLFVKRLCLWPRFHASISAVLERHKPDVVELHVEMTPLMLAIQTAVIDLMDSCMKELRRANPSLDADELTVENGISKSFDKVIRHHLDPVWHQLGSKTKQLVADLKALRLILFFLTQYDSVSFLNILESLRANEQNITHHSLWMFMDAADSLFVHARDRVYKSQEKQAKKQKTGVSNEKTDTEKRQETSKVPMLEPSPKWKALSGILDEVEAGQAQDTNADVGHILIAASDERTCSQLKEYICDGDEKLLNRLYNKFSSAPKQSNSRGNAQEKGESSTDRDASSERPTRGTSKPFQRGQEKKGRGPRKGCKGAGSSTDTRGASKRRKDSGKDVQDGEEPNSDTKGQGMASRVMLKGSSETETSSEGILISSPVIVIHPLTGCSDSYSLTRTLNELEPRYVVLYDAEMEFVRELEVYKATRPGIPLRVYFVIYSGSVEEQKYLTSLRKEKEAFEVLIKAKGSMVVPEEQEGKSGSVLALSRDPAKATDAISTRRAGGRQEESKEPRTVIVDLREFRSELPSLIHKRGIDIEPVTLEVGDYILSPDMCVERKSVSDLISSLNSGRLYNQVVAMTRFYKRPILLIEFDPNKSFSLQAKSSLSSEVNIQNISSKISLLTLHFPKLRILWCQSPYATAELFDELKKGNPEPDSATAAAIGFDTIANAAQEFQYAMTPQDIILKLPGINSKNYRYLMRSVRDFHELFQMSEERLNSVLKNTSSSKELWQFIHNVYRVSSIKTSNTNPK